MLSSLILVALLLLVRITYHQSFISPIPAASDLHLQYINRCCGYRGDDDYQLLLCANISSVMNRMKVMNSIHEHGGPSLGVAIVTFATKEIWNYSAYSLAVNEAYAEHNGYILLHLDPYSYSNYTIEDTRWSKIKILIDAIDPINGWARDLQYIMWIDADVIFLDIDLRIEQVLSSHNITPTAHVIVSAEHSGSTTLINSGTIIVKNSNWSRKFLYDWYTYADRSLYSDQEQFDLLYHAYKDKKNYQQYIKILPPDAINTDPPAMIMQKPTNKVLHLMGEHTAYRKHVFQQAYHEICRFHHQDKTVSSSHSIAPQLNITKSNLHRWAIDIYATESDEYLNNYRLKVAVGANSLLESRRLSNSVHHYAYAITYEQKNHNVAAIKSQFLRQEVYKNIQLNIKNRRVSTNITNDADWPEHLKVLAEAGQHLVSVGKIEDRKQYVIDVMNVLQEILSVCHPHQHDAVMQMVAHMYKEAAIIDLDDGDYSNAIGKFNLFLDISKKLSSKFGQHLLVSPLSAIANLLAMSGRYDDAFSMYQEVIGLIEKHVGVNHHSLSQPLVNYGIALVNDGKHSLAHPVLLRAEALLDDQQEESLVRTRITEYLHIIRAVLV